jgi:hypothetical protein
MVMEVDCTGSIMPALAAAASAALVLGADSGAIQLKGFAASTPNPALHSHRKAIVGEAVGVGVGTTVGIFVGWAVGAYVGADVAVQLVVELLET